MGNVKIYAEVIEDEALQQFYKAMSLPCNVQGALMPDTHTGYTLPIGAVVKSKETIFPAYVGYDIGCGVCAAKLDVKKEQIDLNKLRDYIIKNIPVGAEKQKKPQKYKFNETTKIVDEFKDLGLLQIGTLGGGNHFVEIGEGDDDNLWIVIHSGSRGFGYKIADHYMKEAAIASVDELRYEQEFDNKNKNFLDAVKKGKASEETYNKAKAEHIYRRTRAAIGNVEDHFGLELNSERGQNYLKDMNCALQFALDNRKQMIDNIIKGIKEQTPVNQTEFINRNHNHAEVKDGYVIHRKGATHAEEGMLGVIPGNMKDGSFIVKGKGNKDSMSSSSHGAGRVLSRSKAKQTLDIEDFHKEMDGIITNHTNSTIDEAPKAYKNIFEVMELQSDLVDVIDRVRPVLNIKG